jgi:hypothetical protein
MPLTKVSSGVIAANAVVDSFGTQSITGDKLGLTAINANNIVGGSITGAKLAANTVSGDVIGQNAISSNNIVSVNASIITVGTLPTARLPSNTVLQVVSNTFTSSFTSSSGSFVTIGLTASITPTSSSSRILILIDSFVRSDATNFVNATIYKNGSTNFGGVNGLKALYAGNEAFVLPVSFAYYDSPATTSSTSYALFMRTEIAQAFYLEAAGRISTITLMEIAG